MNKAYLGIVIFLTFASTTFCQQFKVNYSPAVFSEAFTGNILLYLSKDNKNPKDGSVGLTAFPCYVISVKNLQPGAYVTISDNAVSYPVALSDIERGTYYVQAVWDMNSGGRSIAASPGNLYNKTQQVIITKNTKAVFNLHCDLVIQKPVFKETPFVKELKAPSSLLSNFHNKPLTVDAAVLLPKEYFKSPGKKFPVLFIVSGYGGDYHEFSGNEKLSGPLLDTTECISVYLDGNCSLGHSVYANSKNNGPWGDALVQEFIPLLEKQYRCNGARLLKGHSSGGFSVLWLQTNYPKIFTGCASSSPDPVDFRSFQKINLYTDKNMFYDKDSSLILVATVAGFIPWATMKDFYKMENVVYRGEQMHSFDAVFSGKDKNGNPQKICDPVTGDIDTAAVAHWKQYDISLYLRNNWQELKEDLDGKVRISVGRNDNFLLNYAVNLLEEEMKKLNSQFRFAYYPGDHFTVATKEYRKDEAVFLQQKYLEWLEKSSRKNN